MNYNPLLDFLRAFTFVPDADASKILDRFQVKTTYQIFTLAPYLFTSQTSFTQQQPAKENIEALEDCLQWQLSLKDANDLMALPSWSIFFLVWVVVLAKYFSNPCKEKVK